MSITLKTGGIMEKKKKSFDIDMAKRVISKQNLQKIKDGINNLLARIIEDLVEENKRLKIKLAKLERLEKFTALDYLTGKDIPS